MSLDSVEEKMEAMIGDLGNLNATVKFDCKGEGFIFLDATCDPAEISHDDDVADCTIKISTQNLEKLLDGRLDPMLGFTMGKIKVKGSMGIAMKLTNLLN